MFLLLEAAISATEKTEEVHENSALNALLFCFLMALCVFVGYMLKKYKFYYLPESAAVMALGCIAGGLVKAVNPSAEELSFLTFKQDVFFFILLPPIIFEAGYTLNKNGFFAKGSNLLSDDMDGSFGYERTVGDPDSNLFYTIGGEINPFTGEKTAGGAIKLKYEKGGLARMLGE